MSRNNTRALLEVWLFAQAEAMRENVIWWWTQAGEDLARYSTLEGAIRPINALSIIFNLSRYHEFADCVGLINNELLSKGEDNAHCRDTCGRECRKRFLGERGRD